MIKIDEKPCGFWEDYYLDYISRLDTHSRKDYTEMEEDTILYRDIYSEIKILAYKFDYPSLVSLVEAIQKDKDSEDCCIGPEFSIVVSRILEEQDKPFDNIITFFKEAAIRDVLEQYGLYPCYREYVNKKSTNCTICGPVIRQILEKQFKN